MKYLEYRNKMDDEYFPYLRISAYSFLVPTSFYLYYKKYDFFILLFILSLTSILRWTYVRSKLYQYIDHSFVKIVFIICLYSTLISCTKCVLTSILILGCLLNILIFYIVGVYYDFNHNKKCNISYDGTFIYYFWFIFEFKSFYILL